ncbi:MAG: helix-turn-helix domain-containing protein [Dethiobacter sp.]|nr:helix-turn-helix domain-containing protein [Dethiobacter sp.]
MPDIGRELRQAREELNLTLEEISSRTHIAKKYLRAIETGEYRVFPGEVYLKGALRKYAEEVGISPGQIIVWYEATTRESDDSSEQKQEQPPETKRTKITEIKGSIESYSESRRQAISDDYVGSKKTGLKRTIIIFLSVILIAAAALITLMLFTRQTLPDSTPPPPGAQEPAPGEEQPPQVEPQPQDEEPPVLTVERDTAPGAVLFSVSGAETLEVNLIFRERCWVRVFADGRQVVEETFSAGRTFSVVAEREIRVNVGYPPGLRLEINGLFVEIPPSSNPYEIKIDLLTP